MIQHDLKGFTIENFRVFGNKTEFELAPITILTGTNSCGKSSFTKALNLLTKSYMANGLRSLELMESNLKIGDFSSLKNSISKKNEVSFSLDIDVYHTLRKYTNGTSQTFTVELSYIESGLKIFRVYKGSELILEREGNLADPRYGIDKSFVKLQPEVVNRELLRGLFPDHPELEFESICNSIIDYLQTNTQAHTNKGELYDLDGSLKNYDILNESIMRILDGLAAIGEVGEVPRVYYDEHQGKEVSYVDTIITSSNPTLKDVICPPLPAEFEDLVDGLFLKDYLNLELLSKIEILPLDLLLKLFNRFEFIDGVRATQEIVYTKDNSPGFYDVLEKLYASGSINTLQLSKWIVDHFNLITLAEGEKIDDVLKVRQITGFGYLFQVFKDGTDIGLAGLGYGVAQLLPILIKVALHRNAIFIIEEPESNLHPALQSMLADFFVSESNNTLLKARNFIVETHSEYLIRKLQYLVAKKTVKEKNIQLYYFNHPDKIPPGEDQVKQINVNPDGSLTDNFGVGFYDEATSWKFELLKLNNPQKN